MSKLRIRVYNVLFGDAVLVTIPGAKEHHILFDVGNVLSGKGGADTVFEPVIDDIIKETGGTVDLYVMTHEHMDHVQGLFYASTKLNKAVKAKIAWITGSADPDYYDTHNDAKKKKLEMTAVYDAAEALSLRRGARYAAFAAMIANNNPRDTGQCVDFLRNNVAAKNKVKFISRADSGTITQPIPGLKIEILAPEEDTSVYYGRGKPFMAGAIGEQSKPGLGAEILAPPPGVDVGAFADLLRSREEGALNSLLQIDRAANNTSVVLRLTWQGKVLMFAGDAENKSWAFMSKYANLGPVDFLKLGHHGSSNGMPAELVDTLLPAGAKKRHVGLSTCAGCYGGVPYPALLKAIGERAAIHDTRTVAAGAYVDVRL